MSDVYKFVSMKDGTDWSPRIALFGDLGYVNAQSVLTIDHNNRLVL
jgi:hypothetical protein